MLTLFLVVIWVLILAQFSSPERFWAILTLISGVLALSLSGLEPYLFSVENFSPDYTFFVGEALDYCSLRQDSFDFRYDFYSFWLYLSYPCGDFLGIYFMSGVNFLIIWSLIVGAACSFSSNKKLENFFVFSLFSIGIYLSTVFQRDGLFAISLSLIAFSVAQKKYRIILFFLGISLLLLTRPHVFIIFWTAFIFTFLTWSLVKKINPALFSIVIFLLFTFIIRYVPLPQWMASVASKFLVPHGDSSVTSSPLPIAEIANIYSQGGVAASRMLSDFVFTRILSVLYEPNPFRYLFWLLSGKHYSLYKTSLQQLIEIFTAISSIGVFTIILTTFLSRRKHASMALSKSYIIFLYLFLGTSAIYSVKYFGMHHRVLLGFVGAFSILIIIRSENEVVFDRTHRQIFFLWLLFLSLIFVIKPLDWIWNY